MEKHRLLLIDDHGLFREGLARLLAAEPDFEIAHCGSIREAVELLGKATVDLVLLDYDLGAERATQFLPAAAEAGFRGPVLIVTAWIADGEARRLLEQGARGIFPKEASSSELVSALRSLLDGESYTHSRYAHLEAGEDGALGAGIRFDERQRMVLRFVMEGLSNKAIAWRLQISESYVKAILQRLFQKTGVRTRGQLVRVALEQYADQLRQR
jgi:two-component system nitrate/nitrite response regulator NarL